MSVPPSFIDNFPGILADLARSGENPLALRQGLDFGRNFTLLPQIQPGRLDMVMALAFQDMGTRARRRLWDVCRILVNGKSRAAGFEVRGGETITVIPVALYEHIHRPAEQNLQAEADPQALPLHVQHNISVQGKAQDWAFAPYMLAASSGYYAVAKPACLHSARIVAKPNVNIEDMLLDMLAEQFPVDQLPPLQLLTRLDFFTSGIVLAGEATLEKDFRIKETAGLLQKRYFTLVCGQADEDITIRKALDTHQRVTSKVLEQDIVDKSRHTHLYPLKTWQLESGDVSLVEVTINRGARHQIRAHLAYAGFPLVGDAQYASPLKLLPVLTALGFSMQPCPDFLLHHAEVTWPDFAARCMPCWGGLESCLPHL